jgi:hypothetical protein
MVVGAMSVVMGAAAGCGTDSRVATQPNDAVQFWRLVGNQRAITIAVNQTLQLTATPQNGVGVTLSSLPTPTFTSTDTTTVKVDASGVLHAIAPTTTATVIASLTVGGVTAADTIPVVVTTTREAFKSLSLRPAGSAQAPMKVNTPVTTLATDSSDHQLYNLSIRYWVSDPTVASISTFGYLYGSAKGTVWVHASTTSYGVTASDSVQYTITNPVAVTMYYYGTLYSFYPPFYTDTISVGVNGTVTVYNYSGSVAAMNFGSDSLKVTGGNIPSLGLYSGAARTFPTVGRYTIVDQAGHTGLIVVLPP